MLDGGWLVESWAADDGFPNVHHTGIAVGADGFLWIGSIDGLIRYDGQSFVRYRRGDIPGLPSNFILDVSVHEETNTLWLITRAGHVASITDGVAKVWFGVATAPREDGPPVRPGAFAHIDGRLYTIGEHGVFALTDAAVPVLPESLAGPSSWMTKAGDTLWIRRRGGDLLRKDPGQEWRHGAGPPPVRDDRATIPVGRPDGSLVLGGGEVLQRLADGVWTELLRSDEGRVIQVVSPSTASRLVVCHAGRFTEVREAAPLDLGQGDDCSGANHHFVHSDLWWIADRLHDVRGPVLRPPFPPVRVVRAGGELWATHGRVLYRLQQSPIQSAAITLDGAPLPVDVVVPEPAGGVWAGGPHGAALVNGPGPVVASVHRSQTDERAATRVLPVGVDSSGAPWFSRWTACALRDGVCGPPLRGFSDAGRLVNSVFAGSDGRTWISHADTLRVGDPSQAWSEFAHIRLADDSEPGPIGSYVEAGSRLYAATRHRGVLVVDGEQRHLLDGEDGLPSDHVRSLRMDDDGHLWIGTADAGLCLLGDGDTIRCLDAKRGLPRDNVLALEDDGQGRLWMAMGGGLWSVRKTDLHAALDDPTVTINPLRYDASHGVQGGIDALLRPNSTRDRQGRMWFSTRNALTIVDPARLKAPMPPPVVLESLRVGEVGAETDALDLETEHAPLTVSWTSPSLAFGGQVIHRYRIGSGRWIRSDERELAFRYFEPGDNALTIQAGLDGRWGEPLTLRIHRAPRFRETSAFPVSVALLGFLLAGGVGLQRRRALRLRQRELEGEVTQRTAQLSEANLLLADERDRVQEQAELLADQNVQIRRQHAQIAEVEEFRSRIVADLSHELRTPLALVLAPLDDVAGLVAGKGEVLERKIDLLRRNATRLSELVDQLLDVAKLDRGELVLRARRADLAAFVKLTAERFEPAVQSKGLDLRIDVPESVPAWFDPDLLDKVLANLLGNAMKFTEAGHLSIAVEDAGEYAAIRVADTGIGIDATEQARLFERFYQVDDGDDRSHEGVGIGLSLARDLVELHGGSIEVSSEEGAGSVFSVRLPVGSDHLDLSEVALDEGTRPSIAAVVPDGPEHAPLVFVVEDHPDMASYLAEHLARVFRVQVFDRGEPALEAARAHPPALVLSDVMMPGMDGLELSRRLKASHPSLPIALVSAKVSKEAVTTGLQVADRYVTKPFRVQELLEIAQELTGYTPRAAAEVQTPTTPELPEVDLAFLAKLERIIEAGVPDTGFGIDALASAMALSRRQLLRRVRQLTGETPSDMLRDRRLEHADDCLRRGVFSTVSEVAAAVGMTPSYLSRLYKQRYGRTASDVLRSSSS